MRRAGIVVVLSFACVEERPLFPADAVPDAATAADAPPGVKKIDASESNVDHPPDLPIASPDVGALGDASKYDAPPAGLVRGDPEWPQYAHTSSNVSATSARIPTDPKMTWTYDVGPSGHIAYTSPVVGNRTLFYPLYAGGIVAIDAGTGTLRWQRSDVAGPKYGTGAYADGVVFLTLDQGSGSGQTIALRADTGVEVWRRAPGTWGGITVDGGVLYLAHGSITALRAATGDLIWSSTLPCQAPPAVHRSLVYCVGTKGLVALDAASGKPVFEIPMDTSGGHTAVAAEGDRLFFVAGALRAHAASDGRPLWNAAHKPKSSPWGPAGFQHGSPALAYGMVFVLGLDGVTARDAATGAIVWNAPDAVSGYSVSVADGRVLAGAHTLLDANTGAILWNGFSDGLRMSLAAVTDGHFYAGSVDGTRIFGWGGTVPGEPPAY